MNNYTRRRIVKTFTIALALYCAKVSGSVVLVKILTIAPLVGEGLPIVKFLTIGALVVVAF